MDSPDIRKMFGDGPYPFPLESAYKVFNSYISDKLCVMVSKEAVYLSEEADEHRHESYEFTMFNSPQLCLGIDNMRLEVEPDTFVRINSGQSHGPKGVGSKQHMRGILVSKDFMHGIAHEMYSNSDFYFENTNSHLDMEILVLMEGILEEEAAGQAGRCFMLDTLSAQLVILMLRQAKNCRLKEKHNDKPYKKSGIDKVIEYFHEHYDSNSYSFLDIAAIANLSPYHLIRAFKLQTGKTPYEYLVELKMEKARELLKYSKHTITEICYLCGFNNHSHFTNTFRKKTGVSPTEYRKEL